MPSAVASEFERFVVDMGVRREIATALWEADIHSPQELAAIEPGELKKVTTDPLLVNGIHPILQKYLFNISMAKNPYKKALTIIKKHAAVLDDDDDEAMDTGVSADSTVADARPYGCGYDEGGTTRSEGQADATRPTARYRNDGSRFNISGHQMHQSNISFSGMKRQKEADPGHTISISGGNFVQANVFGQAPVTYNNTNTVINTTMEQKLDDDVKRRRTQVLNETMVIDGNRVRLANINWNDGSNFWVDDFSIPISDTQAYQRDMETDDVYTVKPDGTRRALVLNNITFSGMSERTGADLDCERMERILSGLGFQVRRENNKTAAEMKTLLGDFATSRLNKNTDMAVVYIGSHGERDRQGNDTFVGSDGRRVNFNEVRDMFTPKKCPLLAKKPKIFFLQFCRQESANHALAPAPLQTARVRTDAASFVDDVPAQEAIPDEVEADRDETRPVDMVCVYATNAGNKAYRDTADGSWFVTALIRIIKNHAHQEDLLSMLTKVNNSISFNEGMEGRTRAIQVSEVVHSLRKKIFFYPGLHN